MRQYDGRLCFFAFLIALLIEQARPLTPANLVHTGYRAWTVSVRRNFDAGQAHHGWLAWTVAVALPCVLVTGIYLLLLWGVGWPLAMVWNVAVLYVTLGFRQFSHPFPPIPDALDAGDGHSAPEALAHFQPLHPAADPRT